MILGFNDSALHDGIGEVSDTDTSGNRMYQSNRLLTLRLIFISGLFTIV